VHAHLVKIRLIDTSTGGGGGEVKSILISLPCQLTQIFQETLDNFYAEQLLNKKKHPSLLITKLAFTYSIIAQSWWEWTLTTSSRTPDLSRGLGAFDELRDLSVLTTDSARRFLAIRLSTLFERARPKCVWTNKQHPLLHAGLAYNKKKQT
jgi:hypothetical protein